MEIDLSDISQTALIMVLCHAQDAQSNNPILNDQSSIGVLEFLSKQKISKNSKMNSLLKKGKISPFLGDLIVARAKYYDRCCIDFLRQYPDGTIVNIGCGLDKRYERVGTQQSQFIDIDLPNVMKVKEALSQSNPDYLQIAQSVFELDWISKVKNNHVLLLAEGVFMYCQESDISRLFLEISRQIPKAEIVCELCYKIYANRVMHTFSRPSLKFQYGIGSDALFKFGVKNSKEIADWSPNIHWIKDHAFLSSEYLSKYYFKLMKYLPYAKRQIWTAHYNFN